MTYKHRVEAPGIYHVTCRGNNKRIIFLDDHDRGMFLRHLTRVARKYGWKLYAYCLMANHYHVIVEIDERGMSRGFCELNTGYAVWFNIRHGRVNHLFGRRYWSGELEDEESLLNACRYVLQNPVRARLTSRIDGWQWSSYRATVGLAFSDVPLANDELLARFGADRRGAARQFAAFTGDVVPVRHVPRQPP